MEYIAKQLAETAAAEYRNHLRQIRSRTQPVKIELVPSFDTEWLNNPAISGVTDYLQQSGFKPARVMALKGNANVVLAGLANLQQGAFAAIPKNGHQALVTFTTHYVDGTVFECSNAPVAFEPPCPKWLQRHRQSKMTPQDIWVFFIKNRPQSGVVPVTEEGVSQFNEQIFHRYQAWMAERGGASRDELEMSFRAIGKMPVAEEEAIPFLNMARSDEIERALCNWWRMQADAPIPIENILDSLLIIHDELPRELLINAYWCGTNDFYSKECQLAGTLPREAFAELNRQRGSPLRKVFEKSSPLKADFYLPKNR